MKNFYLSKAKILQTFETLNGLIDGIEADKKIHPKEINALRHWIKEHDQARSRRPFDEIIRTIKTALRDNVISDSELQNIRFVCNKVLSTFDLKTTPGTAQIQRLHGIASGITADGEIHPKEWTYLSKWIQENTMLKGSWPYDEIEALTTKHLRSEELNRSEREVILYYLNDFCGFNGNSALTHPLNEPGKAITGICAICPEIEFVNKTFCFTGESKKYPRQKIIDLILSQGGQYKDNISKMIDYLIVGADGSSMWSYSCYGRKVEAAVNLRKQGHNILIIHEFDFWDSLEDAA